MILLNMHLSSLEHLCLFNVQVNSNISAVKSSILPDLEYICNPFSGPPQYSYQPDNCSSNTIKIGDIPEVNLFLLHNVPIILIQKSSG